eukprot:CAMPEP_0116824380 /NCGR_PEP_ID=MMETSP0418-20121206/1365_1 /TAXON_ID=1158023 /ORGANISM="Astrosyne radiata, Strain 13vi08-1A" /LENGTH=188 /DNA_ID=CAMNT_0004452745 /DNA_START=80 /DNA_END=646 /DNA_ORIENTATION=-
MAVPPTVVTESANASDSSHPRKKQKDEKKKRFYTAETTSSMSSSSLPEGDCDACVFCPDTCGNPDCANCREKQPMVLTTTSRSSLSFFGGGGGEEYYTPCQVRRHAQRDSAWLLMGDTIYDATSYVSIHPGGERSILRKCGTDCTVDFHFHSKQARRLWKDHKVGKLRPCPKDDDSGGNNNNKQCIIS